MSYSYTLTDTKTFAYTHARHIAAKVATDLKRMQRFYDKPSDSQISDFEEELVEFLKRGFLDTVIYGFIRDDNWIVPTLRYTAYDLAGASADDDSPGKIRPGADISGAYFCSYLTLSLTWDKLTWKEREDFERSLPFLRTGAPEPDKDGYWSEDLIYSAGGRALDRASLRRY